mmetsp:Transcript_17481/g.37779  ORF Transcript_17481/g.37779 Transcript_17481/m.37779 type:complete len:179 (+) Transcript_17481:129-665(+)
MLCHRHALSNIKPAGLHRRGLVKVGSTATQVVTAPPSTTTSLPSKTLSREEVLALHRKLESRAKALISLEEMQAPTRPKLRITFRSRVGLGDQWKICGSAPELGSMIPEVAPAMRWTNGDTWTLETPIRDGTFKFKAVLRAADGAYVWETGNDRTLQVANGLSDADVIEINIDPRLPQ